MRSGQVHVSDGMLETAWWGPGPAEAPTLVLLHEGSGSVTLWRDVPERLAAATGWGVFAYSRFGYGYSDTTPLPRPMTYMHHEAQVVLPEVLRAAGIERMVLVGHSDGGSIAAIHAGSGGARWDDGAAGAVLVCVITIAAHFFVEDLNIASIRKIKLAYESGGLRQRMARYHRDVDTAFRGWNEAWLNPRFREFDITGLLRHIEVPILALQGAADPYGSDEQLRVLESSVPTLITVRLIADARHSPHLEAEDITLAAMVRFVANLSRDSST